MKVAGIAPIITIMDGAITTASQCSTIMWTQAGEAITEPITGTAANGTTNTSPAVTSRDRDNRDIIKDKDRGNRDIIKDKDMDNRVTKDTRA